MEIQLTNTLKIDKQSASASIPPYDPQVLFNETDRNRLINKKMAWSLVDTSLLEFVMLNLMTEKI